MSQDPVGRARANPRANRTTVLLCLAGPLLLACALAQAPASAEEFIYLGSGPILGDRARQTRSTTDVAPGWQGPDFDDRGWELPEAGAKAGGFAIGSVPSPAAPHEADVSDRIEGVEGEPGAPSPAPAGTSTVSPGPPGPADGGLPSCAGTLYLRRRFDVGPEIGRLASLLLRLRYQDGFAAYLNGVEVARRRLPEDPILRTGTLATERPPVEPESFYIPISRNIPLRGHDNLLALEVHPRTPERCAHLDAELSAADGPRVVRGPYIERLTTGAIDLTVESDVPTAIEVRYGRGQTRTERDQLTGDPALATMHRIHLLGLHAATTYHYQLALKMPEGGTTDLAETSFHTPPQAGRPLRFVVYGDSRSGHQVHSQVIQSVLAEDPDLVLVTGDIVERGTEEGDWDRFFSLAGPLLRQVAVYLVPGNHEYAKRGLGAARLFELFATMFPPQLKGQGDDGQGEDGDARGGLDVPQKVVGFPSRAGGPLGLSATGTRQGDRGYYSFDVAGVHFVGLDSNQFRSPRQLRWLEDDLTQAEGHHPRAIFVWSHEGPYSNGLHGDSITAIRNIVPICERHNVTMFFSGHDHDYERGRRGKLSYVVTGGAGAELRHLRCGAPGKKPCKYSPAAFVNDHNYVRVEVLPGQMKLCPKRIDGTPLEPCLVSRLPR